MIYKNKIQKGGCSNGSCGCNQIGGKKKNILSKKKKRKIKIGGSKKNKKKNFNNLNNNLQKHIYLLAEQNEFNKKLEIIKKKLNLLKQEMNNAIQQYNNLDFFRGQQCEDIAQSFYFADSILPDIDNALIELENFNKNKLIKKTDIEYHLSKLRKIIEKKIINEKERIEQVYGYGYDINSNENSSLNEIIISQEEIDEAIQNLQEIQENYNSEATTNITN